MLIVRLNDQERIDLEAWDACRALLSFLHLPRALTKQELLSHAADTQNAPNQTKQEVSQTQAGSYKGESMTRIL